MGTFSKSHKTSLVPSCAGTKQGKWAFMYICIKGFYFASFYDCTTLHLEKGNSVIIFSILLMENLELNDIMKQEEFDNTKGVIRIQKPKNDKQHKGFYFASFYDCSINLGTVLTTEWYFFYFSFNTKIYRKHIFFK
jgi:hypothetical protein